MKNQHSIRTLLGLTQVDAAMLLRVHRSQWSMFESGKRDLPLPAKQLLAEILTHLHNPQTNEKRANISDERLTERYAETSQELDAELSATETLIGILPEGPSKKMQSTKRSDSSTKSFCSNRAEKAIAPWRCSRK